MNDLNPNLIELLNQTDPHEQLALILILKELERAKVKHPHFSNGDLMYGAAIISEESGELSRATIQYCHENGSFGEIEKETAQTAATSIRMLRMLAMYHNSAPLFPESPIMKSKKSKFKQKLEEALKYEECDQCDGCGWHEGGPTLQTHCKTCDGTGRVLKSTKP